MTGNGDFKTGGFMYAVAIGIIAVVVVESVFFMVKSWKRGKELGLSKETMKNTIFSSALFSIAPAVSILTTVIVLAGALGIVLPWIRLSVIGNLAYETTATKLTLESLDSRLSLSTDITDPKTFGAVAWVMTIGTSFALVLLPIVCKTIQSKVGGALQKNEKTSRLGDIISAAAFIGIIAAFVANAINGRQTKDALTIGDAGFMSVCTLVTAVVLSLILETLCEKKKAPRQIDWVKWDYMIPINKRNIGTSILLSIVTFGIYLIYWECLLVKNVRAIKKDNSSCTGEMLCLIFVPFYSIYWWFTRGKLVKDEFASQGYTATGNEIAYLVLGLFGLVIVSMAIMQNDFNSLPSEVADASTQSNQRSAKKNLKKLEPFAMPISMFAAMGVAVVLNLVLPEAVTAFTWWGNVA